MDELKPSDIKLARQLGYLKWFYIVIGLVIVGGVYLKLFDADLRGLYAIIFFVGLTYLLEVGVRKGVGVALYATYIFSILLLFVFPIGTIIGAILLSSCVACSKESKGTSSSRKNLRSPL